MTTTHPLDVDVRAEVLRRLATIDGVDFGAIGHLLDSALVELNVERAALEWDTLRDALRRIADVDNTDLDTDDGCFTGRWRTREDLEDHLYGVADDALAVLLYGTEPRCPNCVRERPTEPGEWQPAQGPQALCAAHQARLDRVPQDPWHVAAVAR